jgi:hypothetical protein
MASAFRRPTSFGRGASRTGWLVANVCVRMTPITIGPHSDTTHRRPSSRSHSAWISLKYSSALRIDLRHRWRRECYRQVKESCDPARSCQHHLDHLGDAILARANGNGTRPGFTPSAVCVTALDLSRAACIQGSRAPPKGLPCKNLRHRQSDDRTRARENSVLFEFRPPSQTRHASEPLFFDRSPCDMRVSGRMTLGAAQCYTLAGWWGRLWTCG